MKRLEDQLQGAIVAYVRTVAPQCQIAAVPNGGLRSKPEAARLKWMGVLAGIPDLVLVAPGGKSHWIEVKAPKGRLSPEQEAFRHWCLLYSVPWMTARSIDDVKAALANWNIETREAA